MNSIRKPILFLLMASCASAVSGQNANAILGKVREHYATIQDAELRFTQSVRFPVSRVEQRISGKLWMKKGNRYRVETDDLTVVTDGKTVWSYSHPNNQVLIDSFRIDERTYSPERVLLAAPDDFTPALISREKSPEGEVAVLKLTPVNPRGFVRALKLWVREDDSMITRVELKDANDKETTYTVQDVRINQGLNDGIFAYSIPEGVEVVDLR
jgi:chaperone LolA